MEKAIGKALVAGAGVGGIRSALDLAQMGYKVILVDKSDHIGGLLCQLDNQFPTSQCGFCRILPQFNRDQSSQHCLRRGFFHENIEILLSTKLLSVEGEPGDLTITLKQKPSIINPSLCTGCGECEHVCQVIVNNPFNEKLTDRKAVYLPTPHSFSNAYTIDTDVCTLCGDCEKACPTGAIRFIKQDREKFKILVVDDEKIIRSSMTEWLYEEGFTVETAESGQKALELMDSQRFNLMLTDIKMPGMDGVELLTCAKEKNLDLCVVMMTAYAAVDSAVEAMKQGAMDYLIKPFDPHVLISMVLKVFNEFEIAEARVENVDALILSGGTKFFNPGLGKNLYGYGVLPGVVTSMEFERLISGSGPGKGKLVHPTTCQPVKKIAWLQCIGSRDIQTKTPFCSSVCCMISIKEAVLAKNKFGPDLETTIFYMDMRTFGKDFDAYKNKAQQEDHVSFIRARIHSLSRNMDKTNQNLLARYVDLHGSIHEDNFDLVVLSIGQQPVEKMTQFAVNNGIETNSFGFIETRPFSQTKTLKPGIFTGGSNSGLKDIEESVICGSSAAVETCKIMRQIGRKTNNNTLLENQLEVVRQSPRISVMICNCGDLLSKTINTEILQTNLNKIPEIKSIEFVDKLCTDEGLDECITKINKNDPNRLILGACQPCIQNKKINQRLQDIGFGSLLVEILDMVSIVNQFKKSPFDTARQRMQNELTILISKARYKNPAPIKQLESNSNTLVIGGGIAGITAALSIAECGYHVDLVEKEENLGGNLLWMDKTIDGLDIKSYLSEKINQIETHSNVTIHKKTSVETSRQDSGTISTVLKTGDDSNDIISHGVTILATGAREAPLENDLGPSSKNILTQKEFNMALQDKQIDPEKLKTIVMLQCAGSRNEKRNYCSRVCCINALKTALFLKEKNQQINIYILYRDMMSYGFYETFYIEAKKSGVLFFQYEPPVIPKIEISGEHAIVTIHDLLLDLPVEIKADYVIAATGILPDLSKALAHQYEASLDTNSFFKEADSKFRPVDGINYRVFSCGLSLKPCTIEEAVASAQAAASGALQILFHDVLISGRIVSATHTATCGKCEMCVDACPYGARILEVSEEKITVDPAACQGCGICAAVCPSNAAFLEGFEGSQMLDMIDMALSQSNMSV